MKNLLFLLFVPLFGFGQESIDSVQKHSVEIGLRLNSFNYQNGDAVLAEAQLQATAFYQEYNGGLTLGIINQKEFYYRFRIEYIYRFDNNLKVDTNWFNSNYKVEKTIRKAIGLNTSIGIGKYFNVKKFIFLIGLESFWKQGLSSKIKNRLEEHSSVDLISGYKQSSNGPYNKTLGLSVFLSAGYKFSPHFIAYFEILNSLYYYHLKGFYTTDFETYDSSGIIEVGESKLFTKINTIRTEFLTPSLTLSYLLK